MTFSVVIPAYNGEKYIEKAILSALNQTRKPDEIIVHDDNSTDETRVVCEKYSSEVVYCFNPDGPSGFVNGWNRAVSFAKSDFITILHQDDLLYPTFLEEAEQVLKKNLDVRHLFALCDYINKNDEITSTLESCFTEDKKVYSGKEYVTAYKKTYNGNPHIHRCPGVITHRSIFEEGCLYNASAGHIADDDFFYRVGQYTDVVGLLKPLAAYRIHSESETGKVETIELVKRLAYDYVYQVKQWENSTFLDKDDRKYFEYWAIKYLLRLNLYNIKFNDQKLKEEARVLIEQLATAKLGCFTLEEKLKMKIIKLLNKF